MSWQDQLSTLVYSTDKGKIKEEKAPTVTPSDGTAKVRRETKGRKGKGVIVISGLGLEPKPLKDLASKLKKSCGTGGSVVGKPSRYKAINEIPLKSFWKKKALK